MYENVLGREHPSTARTYMGIAIVYQLQGRYAEALEWYGKALAIKEKVLGREHPSTARTWNNIGQLCTEKAYEPACGFQRQHPR
jgi:Tfp pilus assembly protein PilF